MKSKVIHYRGARYVLAAETLEEKTSASPWKVSSPGSVSLSPAQVSDPEEILTRTSGAPTMEDLASTIWRRNPGDFSHVKNPWRTVNSAVAELETVLENSETGKKWKVLLRGKQRRYVVVHCYEC